MEEYDFVIMVLSQKEKKLIQAEAEKKHSSLSHFCLNKILEGMKK